MAPSGKRLHITAHARIQVASALTLVFGFALSKFIAVMFGAEGVGYQGTLLSAGTLVGALAILSIQASIPLVAAEETGPLRKEVVGASVRVLLWTSPPALVLVLLFMLPAFDQFAPAVVVAGVALASASWLVGTIRTTLLSVFADSRTLSIHLVVSVGVGALATAVLLAFMPFEFFPLVVGFGAGLGQLCSLLVERMGTTGRIPEVGANKSRGVSAKKLVSMSIPTYFASVWGMLGQTAMPLILLSLAGASVTGLVRAAMAVGSAVAGTVISSIAANFYPEISRILKAGQDPRPCVTRSLSFILKILVPSTLVFALGAPLLLVVAFDGSFTSASACLVLVALGSLIQVLAGLSRYSLMAAGGLAASMWAQIASALVFIGGVVLAGAIASVGGVGLAYLSSMLVWLSISEWRLRVRQPDASVLLCSDGLTRTVVLAVFAVGLGAAAAWWHVFPTQ